MMNRCKKRWLSLGVIWIFVLVLSGWNITRISQIQDMRQALEMIKNDRRYLRVNTGSIHQVHSQKKRLVHEVDSFGLGFLVVENDLKQLSDAFNLEKIRVEVRNESQYESSVPVHVGASGKITNLAAWLSAVEESFPYLSVSDLEIVKGHSLETGQLTAIFTYRYIVSLLETGENI